VDQAFVEIKDAMMIQSEKSRGEDKDLNKGTQEDDYLQINNE